MNKMSAPEYNYQRYHKEYDQTPRNPLIEKGLVDNMASYCNIKQVFPPTWTLSLKLIAHYTFKSQV